MTNVSILLRTAHEIVVHINFKPHVGAVRLHNSILDTSDNTWNGFKIVIFHYFTKVDTHLAEQWLKMGGPHSNDWHYHKLFYYLYCTILLLWICWNVNWSVSGIAHFVKPFFWLLRQEGIIPGLYTLASIY